MSNLSGLIKGPLRVPGIRYESLGSSGDTKVWHGGPLGNGPGARDTGWLPVDATPPGVYFWCLRKKTGKPGSDADAETSIALNVVLNNTMFWRQFGSERLKSLGMAEYVNSIRMRGGRRTYGKIRNGDLKFLELYSLCNSDKNASETECQDSYSLPSEILNAACKDIAIPSRILKIGKADKVGIRGGNDKGRIDQYRRGTQAAITRYALGTGSGIFKELDFYYLSAAEFNDAVKERGIASPELGPDAIEAHLQMQFKKPRGVLPPWEQTHSRYSVFDARGLGSPEYQEFLQSILECIEDRR